MSTFTKQTKTMQYTEVVYFRDGEEFARERMYDDHLYDAGPVEGMSEQEIEDWSDV